MKNSALALLIFGALGTSSFTWAQNPPGNNYLFSCTMAVAGPTPDPVSFQGFAIIVADTIESAKSKVTGGNCEYVGKVVSEEQTAKTQKDLSQCRATLEQAKDKVIHLSAEVNDSPTERAQGIQDIVNYINHKPTAPGSTGTAK